VRGEVSRNSRLTISVITGIVDCLEKAGWAKRVADPKDRGRVIIHPGPQETDAVDGLYSSYMD